VSSSLDPRVAAVKAALEAHPAVTSVELVGSRAEGRTHRLSDWDLYVRTDDFERIAADLRGLVTPLEPLHQLWDPYGKHYAYMVLLRGPTKLDLCFFDEPHAYEPPYEVSAETLPTIDRHFWDWILWTEQKRLCGRDELVRESLELMYTHMLRPMGVEDEPKTVKTALAAYLAARGRLERELGVSVDRTLEDEVGPVLNA
jgi:predicted nucleotidyltransferase